MDGMPAVRRRERTRMTYRVLATDPLAPQGVDRPRRASPRSSVELKPGLQAGRARARSSATTTRWSSAAAPRSPPTSLDDAGKLRVIGRAGIGVDNIDVAAATQARHRGDEHARRQQRHHRRARARADARARAPDPAGRRVAAAPASGSATSSPAPSLQQDARHRRPRQHRRDRRRARARACA